MSDAGGNVELYQDGQHEWRWRRRAANGEIIADSGEGYVHHRDCLAMAVELFPALPILEITVEQKAEPGGE